MPKGHWLGCGLTKLTDLDVRLQVGPRFDGILGHFIPPMR